MNLRQFISVIRYPSFFIKCKQRGSNLRFSRGGLFTRPEEIRMGNNIYIGPKFHISPRSLVLQNNILIGPNFLLEGEDHIFSNTGQTIWNTRHIKDKGENLIENDVWIGGNVTVLKNVTISEGCIVGAGSVVTKSLPPYSICVGVPCRPIKSRFTDKELKLHLEKVKSNYSIDESKIKTVLYMKKVLLLYPKMLFYKITIFNKLEEYLYKQGYELIIWSTDLRDPNNLKKFKSIDDLEHNIKNYKKVLKDYQIDYVINILFKRKPSFSFYISSILIAKIKGISVIFYGHGINKQKDTFLSNVFSNLFYFIFDGIILYSPLEKEKIWKIFHQKITIAYNTLDIEGNQKYISSSKTELRNKYQIKQNKIVLSTGRFQERKQIHILLEFFLKGAEELKDTAWLIVGSELSEEFISKIKEKDHIYYLGAIYDPKKMSEIFYMSDIYSVPGALGLGIVEATYWGLPIITTARKHGPELFYLNHGYNGFKATDKDEYFQKLTDLISNIELLNEFSQNAKTVFRTYGTLDMMFSGFLSQLKRFK